MNRRIICEVLKNFEISDFCVTIETNEKYLVIFFDSIAAVSLEQNLIKIYTNYGEIKLPAFDGKKNAVTYFEQIYKKLLIFKLNNSKKESLNKE